MQKNQPKQFLGYLHNFRGFAIINIVAIHAVVFAFLGASNFKFNPNNPIAIANEILFHNATIYFAVISGILFSAVLKSKGYKLFILESLKMLFCHTYFSL
jgi:surface polysaccharide O-acyltransferase-like enzyme